MSDSLLDWTGHPLVDVGIATLCAMTGREQPTDLTAEDLDRAATEMEEYYFSGLLTAYLSCVFMNSEYVQPGSGKAKEDKRREYAIRVLRAHRWKGDLEAVGLRCALSGRAATHLVHRVQVPMLTAEGVLNFYPAARGGLAISGPYLTAIQALPLGGRRSEGRLLIAHSDLAEVTCRLAQIYLADNRRLLALARAGGLPQREGPAPGLEREQAAWDSNKRRPKFPDAKAGESLITSDLMRLWDEREAGVLTQRPFSVSAYWLSSSGQGPSLELFHLPSNLIRFLVLAGTRSTRDIWRRLVANGWLSPARNPNASHSPQAEGEARRTRRKRTQIATTGGPGRSRNEVLADLIRVYQGTAIHLDAAHRFLRRHVLSEVQSQVHSAADCNWALADLFLKEVLGMEPRRIEAIRAFADRLADHVQVRNDRALFRGLLYARRFSDYRNALVKAQRNEARSNGSLLFGLDEFLTVFESEESVGRLEWSLVRDLISIRVVEKLHSHGFLTPDLLGEEAAPEGQEENVVED